GRDSERDDIRERIQVGPQSRGPPKAAGPIAIQDVEAQGQEQKPNSGPNQPISIGDAVLQAEKHGHGSAGAIPEREDVCHGVSAQHREALFSPFPFCWLGHDYPAELLSEREFVRSGNAPADAETAAPEDTGAPSKNLYV